MEMSWSSNDATLEYGRLEELTSKRDVSGKVGSHNFVFEAENGPKITGNLNMPLSPVSRIEGSATWLTTGYL